jgi:bifunctional aspartokinase / homoserine dehydrogenase 1
MTADPRLVPEAHTIPTLSYAEAAELSYFGAKVLHPLTIVPAARKRIPILIKNTFKPDAPGTRIYERANGTGPRGKAITTMNKLSLITVQGKGLTGVPGVAAKVFGAIAAEHINVMFISQASSEYNITFVVRSHDGDKAVQALKQAFALELMDTSVEMIKQTDKLAIVAVVGEGMMGHPGIAGQTFTALGDAGVNIIAIAQGSSELNISLVIDQADVPTAVRSIHQAFHMVKS